MTSRFSLLEKQNGNNEVPLFLRVDRMYYSLLGIFGICVTLHSDPSVDEDDVSAVN